MGNATILSVAAAYIIFLFGLAYVIDRRVAGERHIRLGPWTYGLSLAVYCTAWTFYGSVGEAAVRGIDFLPIYLGPILVFTLGMPVVRKIVVVGRAQHITSIADFIAARHGKSHALAGFVTLIAVIGIMPYISLQLKAVSATLDILHHDSALPISSATTALYVTLAMFLFCVVFGTRRVDATEQHRGLIAAIALESMVKLAAFLAIGLFVVFIQFDGPGALFAAARQRPELASLLDPGPALARAEWWAATVLAMAAVIGLPRQFQVTVVENTDARHLRTAAWVFPLYLMAMAAFVLPIALGGRLVFAGSEVYVDTYVLALPIAGGHPLLALLVFIGGLSAATAMVLAETIALSTMVSNDLVIPLLLRAFLAGGKAIDPGRWVKWIRRASIAVVLLLAYSYVRLIGDSYSLVGLGLLSFGAAAQFVPVLIGGLYWRGASRAGAFAGLAAGFAVWGYTLLLPSFVRSGLLPSDLLALGPFGIAALRPEALFGLTGLTPLLHGALWCTAANIAGYVGLSLLVPPSAAERRSAEAFIDGPHHRPTDSDQRPRRERTPGDMWRTSTTVGELSAQVAHFVDPDRVERACQDYAHGRSAPLDAAARVDAGFTEAMERLLAGAIGTASARVVVAAALKERDMDVDGVMTMLDNASHAIGTSREMLRDAIETISQGITMVDADGRLLVWNRRFVELLDLPDDRVFVGAPLASMPHPASPNGEDGPDGGAIEVVRRPLPKGGFVTTYTDITERKRQERALRQAYDELEIRVEERTRELRRSEERFRDIAESASDWFWETGPDLQVDYISNRFLEITGLAPADIAGRMLWEIRDNHQPPVPETAPWADLIEAMRAHQPVRGFEYAVACADGRTHHIRLTGKPRFGDDGIFLGYRGTGADITELVATQADLMRSEKLAALGGLVAGVAHEINTPLGIGVTAASFLDERTGAFAQLFADDDVTREDLEAFIAAARDTSASLRTNLRRAADLVRSFKHVAADQSSEQRRRFNLRAYIDEVLVSLQPTLRRTRHRIDVDAAHDIEIVSYPGVVSQILTNLIMNSLIHAFEHRDEGRIRIAAARAADRIVLDYADDGKGMTPEQARRIFEPFFTTRRGQGGTGLGMHIVYNLVTQTLGGRIECRTAPGQGASFHMTIPENQEGANEPA